MRLLVVILVLVAAAMSLRPRARACGCVRVDVCDEEVVFVGEVLTAEGREGRWRHRVRVVQVVRGEVPPELEVTGGLHLESRPPGDFIETSCDYEGGPPIGARLAFGVSRSWLEARYIHMCTPRRALGDGESLVCEHETPAVEPAPAPAGQPAPGSGGCASCAASSTPRVPLAALLALVAFLGRRRLRPQGLRLPRT